MSSARVFISCGFTHVPAEEFASYFSFIETLEKSIREECGADVRHGLQNSAPLLSAASEIENARRCYLYDREMVEGSDIVIVEASYPSIGVGLELQLADNQRIPIVFCYNNHPTKRSKLKGDKWAVDGTQLGEGFVSQMALGVPSVAEIVTYEEVDAAVTPITEAASRLLMGSPSW